MIKKTLKIKAKKTEIGFPSELRFDLVSKDWVVIATGRAKRPEMFKEKKERPEISQKICPFCNIKNQESPTLIYAQGEKIILKKGEKIPSNWTTLSVPNKYPAFIPTDKLNKHIEGGVYQTMNAVGFHEIVVTRDHKKHIAQFSISSIKEVLNVYYERYLSLMKEKFVNYVSVFHNYGPAAGATVSHPHSQIVTTPLIDVDLRSALSNSERYFKKHKKCIYCVMGEWERKSKKRVIFENKDFLVVCPFASKSAFEIIISPKKHKSNFEKITEEEKWQLAEAFQAALGKLHKGLNDPDYNFYLHTAPCDGKNYDHYHWHWTILPKTSIWAGFEIGTRMEISTIEPEKAAEYLRKQ